MHYRLLGRTGVRVSPLCLGTMMFGAQTTAADSIAIIHKAMGQGVNFIDTADMYSVGESERVVGQALQGRRAGVVLATKGRNKMGEGPNDWGTSRLHMRQALDATDIGDVRSAVAEQVRRPGVGERLHAGQRVAITAGSRGIDRIDEVSPGGLAIVDYKSGRVVQPSRWTGDRPEGIQLAVYAGALARTTGEPIRALAYAQVRAGEVAVTGIAEAADVWPTLDVPGTVADWQAKRDEACP